MSEAETQFFYDSLTLLVGLAIDPTDGSVWATYDYVMGDMEPIGYS
jgi:hypothetical protein